MEGFLNVKSHRRVQLMGHQVEYVHMWLTLTGQVRPKVNPGVYYRILIALCIYRLLLEGTYS